jgi:hypothetical protein
MHASSETSHVSQNRLEGSLGDTPIDRLLDECHKNLVTGTIWVRAPGKLGRVELRAGAVDTSEFADLTGNPAIEAMRKLPDGMYELVQRLPNLDGALGKAAQFEGDVHATPLVKLMQHCENNALSCTVTIETDEGRGEIEYRAGELVEVRFDGKPDDDKIVDLVRLSDAHFRVAAPPLDLGIEGWPAVGRAPTAPFLVDEPRPRARGTSSLPALADGTAAGDVEVDDGIDVETHADAAAKPRRKSRAAVWFIAGIAVTAGAVIACYVIAKYLVGVPGL